MSGNLRDMQPDHIKTKMDRIHDFYRDTLGFCKGDRDLALLHVSSFMVQMRDYMMSKMDMPSDRLERAVALHYQNEGYETACRVLVEDIKLYREKVARHFNAVAQERATQSLASQVPLIHNVPEQGVSDDTRAIESNVGEVQGIGESPGISSP